MINYERTCPRNAYRGVRSIVQHDSADNRSVAWFAQWISARLNLIQDKIAYLYHGNCISLLCKLGGGEGGEGEGI